MRTSILLLISLLFSACGDDSGRAQDASFDTDNQDTSSSQCNPNQDAVATTLRALECEQPSSQIAALFTLEHSNPRALLVDGDRIIVVDASGERLHVGNVDGTGTSALGDAGSEPGQLRGAAALATIPGSGRILVLDSENRRVQFLARTEMSYFFDGAARVTAPDLAEETLTSLSAMSIDRSGRVLIADAERRDIRSFRGESLRYEGIVATESSSFALDESRNRLWLEREAGLAFRAYIGSDTETTLTASDTIRGIAFDSYGFIYASNGEQLVIVDPHSGEILLAIPGAGEPSAITLDDEADLLLVGDPGGVHAYQLSALRQDACLGKLVVHAPSLFVNTPTPIRVELFRADGAHDWMSFRQTVTLSASHPDGTPVAIEPQTMVLHNGAGAASVTIGTTGPVEIFARMQGFDASVETTVHENIRRTLSGHLSGEDLNWSGVIHITGDVDATDDVVIDEGTLVLIDEGVGGVFHGAMTANGGTNSPIAVVGFANERWGEFRHLGTAIYRNTYFASGGNSLPAWEYPQGHCCKPVLFFAGPESRFEGSAVVDSPGAKGVLVSDGNFTVENSYFGNLGLGLEVEATRTRISDSWVVEMRGPDDNDGIYLFRAGACCVYRSATCTRQCGEGSFPPTDVELRRVVVADGDDDGIDSLFHFDSIGPEAHPDSPRIVDVMAYGWADKGMSLSGGNTSIENALVVHNGGVGIKVDDLGTMQTSTRIHRSTLAFNGQGFRVGPEGRSNLIYSSLTDVIVFDNDVSLSTTFSPTDIDFANGLIQPPVDGFAGECILSGDPLFLNSEREEYRTSPALPVSAGFDGF